MLRVCIDTNVWISGILFSGPPATVVKFSLMRSFQTILSPFIIDELERNLIKKFDFPTRIVSQLSSSIIEVSEIYKPSGTVDVVKKKHADNLVLETALIGKAKYLVTGDHKHLLPIKNFKDVEIVDSRSFLKIFAKKN